MEIDTFSSYLMFDEDFYRIIPNLEPIRVYQTIYRRFRIRIAEKGPDTFELFIKLEPSVTAIANSELQTSIPGMITLDSCIAVARHIIDAMYNELAAELGENKLSSAA